MTRSSAADILCIGAQRSMTSWLHRVMSTHPATWAFPDFAPVTSTSKEAHYWDWNHHRGPDWYRVLLRPLDDTRQSLDFTPEYAFLQDHQIAECRRLNPTAKVLYILRDPLARAVSALRMHTVWASKHAAPDAVRLRHDRVFLDRCKHARLWDHGAYVANIRRWRRHYPDLLVLNYEDLRADPLAGLQTILTHCALDYAGLPPDRRADLGRLATQVIWKTPAYPLDADCLHFLNGATWTERQALERELGITFAEGASLIEGIE
ncbi:MAG: sulfotransferase [Pararhodobacter sp.]|nr:sulfotransferase [Pararhodobacter sp.]